jgi:hypothetical protein
MFFNVIVINITPMHILLVDVCSPLITAGKYSSLSERNRLAGFEAKFRNNYRATRGAWGDLFYAKIGLYILRNYRLGATYHKQT